MDIVKGVSNVSNIFTTHLLIVVIYTVPKDKLLVIINLYLGKINFNCIYLSVFIKEHH